MFSLGNNSIFNPMSFATLVSASETTDCKLDICKTNEREKKIPKLLIYQSIHPRVHSRILSVKSRTLYMIVYSRGRH